MKSTFQAHEEGTEYKLNINGLMTVVTVSNTEMLTYIEPLFERWTDVYRKKHKRIIIFLAAAPGSGKSTFASLLENVSKTVGNYEAVQSLGVDGFHYYCDHLNTHTCRKNGKDVLMASVKGSPETFDVPRLHDFLIHLQQEDTVMWPHYSRIIHDPEEEKIKVSANIVIIEGNYLLLNTEPWHSLLPFSDESIYLQVDESILKRRLISRKISGGLSFEQASIWYEQSDSANIQQVIHCSLPSDIVIQMNESGSITRLTCHNTKGFPPKKEL